MKKITSVKRYLLVTYKKLSEKSKKSFDFLLSIQNDCLDLHQLTIKNNSDMKNLENKIKKTSTNQLIDIFKKLESNNTDEANLVNDLVMSELELRLPESVFIKLLDEVYDC